MRFISERALDVNEVCMFYLQVKGISKSQLGRIMGILMGIGMNLRNVRIIANMGKEGKMRVNGEEMKCVLWEDESCEDSVYHRRCLTYMIGIYHERSQRTRKF